MAIVLRATKGSALTIAELDGNFTDLDGRVTTLEGTVGLDGVGIADITQDGSQLTFTMTDATEYVFTFAGNGFAWRGEWVTATGYVVDDVITVDGSGVYLVLKSHTAAATFDPDALVSGSPAYALMIADTGGGGVVGAGSGASGTGYGGSVSGAMVSIVADQTNTTAFTYMQWDFTDYKTEGGMHSTSVNNERLTVPPGASFVRVGCTIYAKLLTAGSYLNVEITRSAGDLWQMPMGETFADVNDEAYITLVSGPLPTVAGQYFSVLVGTDEGTPNFKIDKDKAVFWMEVLA